MANRTITLSVAFGAPTVSGTVKTPKRVSLSSTLDEPSVSGTISLPIRFVASISCPEMTVGGRLKNLTRTKGRDFRAVYDITAPHFVISSLKYQAVPRIFAQQLFEYNRAARVFIGLESPYEEVEPNCLYDSIYYENSERISKIHNVNYRLPEKVYDYCVFPWERIVSKSDLVFTSSVSTWTNSSIVGDDFVFKYQNCQIASNAIETQYENSANVFTHCRAAYESNAAYWQVAESQYAFLSSKFKALRFPYNLTETINDVLVTNYNFEAVDKVWSDFVAPLTLEQDFNAIFAETASASIRTSIGVIDPIRLEVSTSLTESVWQVSAQIDPAQSPLALMNDSASISLSRLAFSATLSGKSVTKSAQAHNISIEAYSQTRSLSLAPAPIITAITSTQAFFSLGFNSLIGLINSNIKALDTVNQSVLSVSSNIATDMGATIISRPNGTASIIPTWKPSGSDWVIDESDILELQESFVDGIGYNRIIVSDGVATANQSMQTEVVQDGASWLLYVYGVDAATVSHTQSNASIDNLGRLIVSKTAQVEFIDGVANLSHPINNIIAINWLNNALTSTPIIDGNSVICGTVGNYGLAAVDYTVKPLAYRITYDKTEPIQLIIKEH